MNVPATTTHQFSEECEQWERQPWERPQDYALFADWMSQPVADRKPRVFAARVHMGVSNIRGLMRLNRWDDRLAASMQETERIQLLAIRDVNKQMSQELSGVMAKVPKVMEAAFELGLKTINTYLEDSYGEETRKLSARDAVSLFAAVNALGNTATRYLETAGELTRKMELNINGQVRHVMQMPSRDELTAFAAALADSGVIARDAQDFLEASLVEEPLELEAGDG